MIWLFFTACESPPSALPVVVDPDPAPALDPGEAAARYDLTFDEAHAHRVGIDASAVCPEDGALEWWMPVWTPGSYLVREYARHVEAIEGRGGALTKVSKNRWRQDCAPGEAAGVRYELYARTMSVRDSFVDREMAVLNGASVFLFPDGTDGPLDVRFARPDAWATIQTALPPHPSGDADRFLAPTVDTLIDAPILLGTPDVRSFEVGGVPHQVVTLGVTGPFDLAGIADQVQRVTQAHATFWGTIPYREYRFMTVLAERGGGLEHLDSTLMMTSRWTTSRRKDRLRYLGLVSHEFFHTWNVKRLRPEGLGPFDYENEVYTPSLWISEGLTSYYDDVLLSRAGLLTEDEYLERMSQNVGRLQGRPGRLVQPLGEASFDAWVKHYRRDENTTNQTVSYYTKGAVVGWLLDAEIRRATRDRVSLDDVMREMWQRHRETAFTPADFRTVAAEVAGRDLSEFFARTVDRTDELDFGGALQWWGLRWKPTKKQEGNDPVPGSLGVDTRTEGERLVVSVVKRGTPAYEAGINVEDEIIAVDDERITSANLSDRLAQLGEGHTGTWLVARRGRLLPISVTLGAPSPERWTLEPDPGASPAAARRRAAWLGSPK